MIAIGLVEKMREGVVYGFPTCRSVSFRDTPL